MTETCTKCRKESMKKYSQTEKGKQAHQKANRKYNQTERGKEQHRQNSTLYRQRHPEYAKKYRATVKGHLRQVYGAIKHRCTNLNYPQYKDYGGRGIKNKFKSSQEFVDYVINILQIDPRGLQIDRINNSGHYEPGNIRFVTAKENINNRRK